MKDFLSIAEAAAELGIPRRTIQYRIKTGHIAAERLGGSAWAIPKEEVERWRNRGKLTPGKPKEIPDA